MSLGLCIAIACLSGLLSLAAASDPSGTLRLPVRPPHTEGGDLLVNDGRVWMVGILLAFQFVWPTAALLVAVLCSLATTEAVRFVTLRRVRQMTREPVE